MKATTNSWHARVYKFISGATNKIHRGIIKPSNPPKIM